MGKVLIVTYYWPPSGGAGVQRWLKFSKYLPGQGWEPVILTVDPKYASYPQKDPGLLKEVPGNIEVIRTKAMTELFSAYKHLTGKKEVPYGGFVNESNPGFTQKLLRFIRGNLFLPDARKGWNRFALKAAIRLIKEKNINAVITSSPPHSTQIIGLKLKKKLNIKWVADIRDPWSDIYYSSQLYQTTPAKMINRLLESRVINSADRVIATCNATAEVFRSRIKNNFSNKVVTITNGFDPEDFTDLPGNTGEFAITYLGTLSGNYDVEVLLMALDHCATRSVSEITFNFVGKTDENVAVALKMKKNVRINIFPYMEHKRAMEFLSSSSACLLIVPAENKTSEMIPGKLFEYLASARPVIAIGPPDGDVASILEETGGGKIFGKKDSEALGNYILSLHENHFSGNKMTRAAETEKYSRKLLAGEIAGLLDTL